MMNQMFSLKNISKTYGDDILFQSLSFDFKSNEKMGLIGMNGSGKSTLLKLIAGEVQPDTGELITRTGLRIVYLPQQDRFDPHRSIEEHLYNCVKDSSFDGKEQHRIVQKAIGETGFPDPKMKVSDLSGGWKKKLSITCALCCRPDLLLLDEPTNHLDINGIFWLEKILKSARFSFIVVSHDRSFLENVCSNIMEIGQYYPSGYFKIRGQYKEFEKERQNFLLSQEKQQVSLAGKMRREEEWLRQGAKARSTKAKYRIEQAENLRMELSAIKERNKATAKLDIDFDNTGRQTKSLLRAYHIKKTINGTPLFSDITFELRPGFVLGVAGENGTGKSTFLSILEKTTQPDEGKVEWVQELKLQIFDQNRSRLSTEMTLKEALNPAGGDSVNFKGNSIHIVTWAKRFLFMPDQLDMPVKKLSGGEKARVILANIMLTPCDVLLLDEPTNDLDILSLEVLEESIRQFPGAVVIVSHDRYLMNKVCHRILYLDPVAGAHFFADFDQVIKQRQSFMGKPEKTRKPEREKPARIVKFSFKDKFELDHIEEKILEAEAEVEEINSKIQDIEIINHVEEMNRFCSLLKDAQEKVHMLYERWESLEMKKKNSDL